MGLESFEVRFGKLHERTVKKRKKFFRQGRKAVRPGIVKPDVDWKVTSSWAQIVDPDTGTFSGPMQDDPAKLVERRYLQIATAAASLTTKEVKKLIAKDRRSLEKIQVQFMGGPALEEAVITTADIRTAQEAVSGMYYTCNLKGSLTQPIPTVQLKQDYERLVRSQDPLCGLAKMLVSMMGFPNNQATAMDMGNEIWEKARELSEKKMGVQWPFMDFQAAVGAVRSVLNAKFPQRIGNKRTSSISGYMNEMRGVIHSDGMNFSWNGSGRAVRAFIKHLASQRTKAIHVAAVGLSVMRTMEKQINDEFQEGAKVSETTMGSDRDISDFLSGAGGEPPWSMEKRGKWGKATLKEVLMPRKIATYQMGMKATASDEGTLIRNAWRWPVDGRLFTRTIRQYQCSVLVDVSGSMRFAEDDLENLLSVMPRAVVAVYSGKGDGTGTILVVGRDGRFGKPESWRNQTGGLNVIDGPALMWLAKQNGPRIWVSDGWVTGIPDQVYGRAGETVFHNLFVDAKRICKANGIERISTAQRAIAYFKNLQRSRR